MVDGKPAVYFDERFTDPKPFTDLDNAGGGNQILGGGAAAGSVRSGGGGGRTRYDEDEGEPRGMRFDQLSGRNSSNPYSAQAVQWNEYGSVVSFRIDVQFRPSSELPAPSPTPTMSRGGGGRGQDRYDSDE